MSQPGIVAPVPSVGRVLTFELSPDADVPGALTRLAARKIEDEVVFGVGPIVMARMGQSELSLQPYPVFANARVNVPSTQAALVVILRAEDRGDIVNLGDEIVELLSPDFDLTEAIDTFRYRDSRDLTGFKDGTENPEDRAAEVAYAPTGSAPGVRGGSFLAISRWVHDLTKFRSFSASRKDDTIGRRLSDNEEFDEAPENAHVKRAAQESFAPEAFLLRRSTPYTLGTESGLVFVAYAASQEPFAQILKRMVGAEDGIVDALFDFSTPVTGGCYFCPPLVDGHLDLTAVVP